MELAATDPIELRLTAFEHFYHQRYSEIYRAVMLTVGDRDLAVEAIDEAMTRAFARWSKISEMSNPSGWVYRVATNWARSRLRRRKLAMRTHHSIAVVPGDIELPDAQLIEAVRSLPTHQRNVVVARYLLDMSEAETAEALGIPRGTAKSRTNRALSRLKEQLS